VSFLAVAKQHKMKTHKVIDVTTINEDALFYGTIGECYEWKVEQGFGYKVLPLDKEEKALANSL
jgi:hypothetical protein